MLVRSRAREQLRVKNGQGGSWEVYSGIRETSYRELPEYGSFVILHLSHDLQNPPVDETSPPLPLALRHRNRSRCSIRTRVFSPSTAFRLFHALSPGSFVSVSFARLQPKSAVAPFAALCEWIEFTARLREENEALFLFLASLRLEMMKNSRLRP